MHEVNHRAKNMLSVVQAVARQTAAREPEDFIGRFNERIQALAANQDLLVRTEWRGGGVEGPARAPLAHFSVPLWAPIAGDGPRLHLKWGPRPAIRPALDQLAAQSRTDRA